MADRQLRIAVLVCNESELKSPPIFAVKGDYDEMVRRWLASALSLLAPRDEVDFDLEAYDVIRDMAYPDVKKNTYDGIFIGGSSFSANDQKEWINRLIAFIRDLVVNHPKVKLFGFCFGHQIISRSLGSTIERNKWEVSVTQVDLTPFGKHVYRAEYLNLQMFHHDRVVAPPAAGLIGEGHLIGSSSLAPTQGMVIFNKSFKLRDDLDSYLGGLPLKEIHVLTLQGHPEYTEATARNFIADGHESFDADYDIKDAHARAWHPVHAYDKVGGVIWGVLGVGKGGF